MRYRKTLGWVLALAALAWGGARYAAGNGKTGAEGEGPRETVARRGAIERTVTATGRIVSNRDVDIKCKASGQIIHLPWEVSDRVDTGELLLELDPVDEERRVRIAEATLGATEARIEQARRSLSAATTRLAAEERRAAAERAAAAVQEETARAKAERSRKLYKASAGSAEESEAAASQAASARADLERSELSLQEIAARRDDLAGKENDLKIAQAQLEKDRISLDEARQRLKETKVYAPIAGIVSLKPVEAGQIVSSGVSNVGGGTSVMTLSDLSRVFVLAAVDEANIGHVECGMRANVKVDALPERRFGGVVTRVAPRGKDVSNVVTFECRVEVTRGDVERLKPEMSADVEISCGRREDAILLPVEAVRRRGPRRFVAFPSGATCEVEVGLSTDTEIEILSGVAEGDRVTLPAAGEESRWQAREGGPGGRPAIRIPGMGGRRR